MYVYSEGPVCAFELNWIELNSACSVDKGENKLNLKQTCACARVSSKAAFHYNSTGHYFLRQFSTRVVDLLKQNMTQSARLPGKVSGG